MDEVKCRGNDDDDDDDDVENRKDELGRVSARLAKDSVFNAEPIRGDNDDGIGSLDDNVTMETTGEAEVSSSNDLKRGNTADDMGCINSNIDEESILMDTGSSCSTDEN